MNKEEFHKILENPASITGEQTRDFERILAKNPYFQTARALRLKALKEQDSPAYNAALKKTAAYTTDRSILFDFITSKEFSQNQIAKQIKAQEEDIKNIVVYEVQEVFGRRSIAIDEAIKMKQSESERVLDPDLFEEAIPEEKDEENTSSQPAKEELDLGKPLDFDQNESHSFSEWLKLTSAKPVREKKSTEEVSRKFELIDEFISKSPRIKPARASSKTNLAERNSTPPESLMTETLARVYLEQKNYAKAIQAYKILILKNPEKSGFFADHIRAIEKLQDTNTNKE